MTILQLIPIHIASPMNENSNLLMEALMERDDTQLIHSILSGDEDAFSELVRKYEKSVHAHAWRKIKDYHIAEEITQDAFL